MEMTSHPEPESTSLLSPVLTEEERLLLAGKELDASEQDWEAADVLVSQRLHRDALTRAAMSLFHAARGLLLREGYNVRDPHDVLELLSLRFSGAGEMPPEAPAVLARAQTYCDLADFGVGWVVTAQRVVAEIEVYEEHRTGLLAMLAQRGVKPGAS